MNWNQNDAGMVTEKLLNTIRLMHANGGSGEISVSKWVSTPIHPTIAKNLRKLGWAKYGPGGVGNTKLLFLTESGIREAKIVAENSEGNAKA